MTTSTWIAFGALLVSTVTALIGWASQRSAAITAAGNLSLSQLNSANVAMGNRIDDLEDRLVHAEREVRECRLREDALRTQLVKAGIFPTHPTKESP
jgi:hypothetical protein